MSNQGDASDRASASMAPQSSGEAPSETVEEPRPDDSGGGRGDPVDAHVHAEAHPRTSMDAARDARHDAVLVAVPAPLAAGAAVGLLSPVSLLLSVCLGSVLAAGIVGWALFLAPPV